MTTASRNSALHTSELPYSEIDPVLELHVTPVQPDTSKEAAQPN